MSKQRSCRSANRVDVVGEDRLSDDLVAGVWRMREIGVRALVLANLVSDLALNSLEVLGEPLFGKLFEWWLHRTSPALVYASVPGRDPWPTARPALVSATGCMRLHPHTLYDLCWRSVAGAASASAHRSQTTQYSRIGGTSCPSRIRSTRCYPRGLENKTAMDRKYLKTNDLRKPMFSGQGHSPC